MKKVLLVLVLVIASISSMLLLTSCDSVKYGDNLVVNGDYESTVTDSNGKKLPSGWTVGGDSTHSTITLTTTSDLAVGGATGNGKGNIIQLINTSSTYSYFYQKVKVKKNSYYKLEADILVRNTIATDPSAYTGTLEGAGAFVGFVESDAFVYETQTNTTDTTTTTKLKWVHVSIYVHSRGYTELTLAIRLGTETSKTKAEKPTQSSGFGVYFDNVSMVYTKSSDVKSAVEANSALAIRTISKTAINYADGLSVFLAIFFALISVAVCYLLYYFIRKNFKTRDAGLTNEFKKLKPTHLLLILLGAGFLVRILITQLIGGYAETTGPAYFSSLLDRLTSGFAGWPQMFTTSEGRSQTPGMLLIYAILGGIANLFKIELLTATPSAGIDLLTKIPGMIADLIAIGYLFIFARKTLGDKTAFIAALLYALLPSVFITSAGWGSADSILALFLMLTGFAILDKKYILVAVYMTLAVVFNQKALYVLPLVAVFLAFVFYRNADKRLKLGITAAACIIGFWVVSIPFTDFADNPFGVFVQYTRLVNFGTSGTLVPIIDRTSLDAFNFYTMIGSNTATYSSLQAVFDIVIALCIFAGVIALYFKRKNRAELVLLSAFAIIAIFMFTLGMQPFSMVFGLLLLLVYLIISGEKRVFFIFSAFSLTTVVNLVTVLSADGLIGGAIENKLGTSIAYSTLLNPGFAIFMSVVNFLIIAYFAYVIYDITYKGRLKNVLPWGDDSGDGFVLGKVKETFGKVLSKVKK
ncbi:MAG: hypothetical protein LBT20_08410 [Clostridiales bacterium]|jgi:Gpi18-like mannosyltransferase|nr:hypothetical protein [Clostridiales bacterium]